VTHDRPAAPEGTAVIEQTVLINAAPETVWRLWTRPEGLMQWWGIATEVVPAPGGPFRVEIGPVPGPVMRGRFVDVDPPHRLVFTFGWESDPPAGPMPPGSTLVEVTLTPDGRGTRLVLEHRDLPAPQTDDHRRGWEHYLGVLVEVAASVPPHAP
jgi:uncharacterized protein YndB with AHSA1/START domain